MPKCAVTAWLISAHKTLEGTGLQCEAAGGVSKIICSTLVEVHQVVAGGLVDEGPVDDVSLSSRPLPLARPPLGYQL